MTAHEAKNGQKEHSLLPGGSADMHGTVESVKRFLRKLGLDLRQDPATLPLGTQPKDPTSYHRHLPSHAHCSSTHHSQELERPRELPTEEWTMAMWNTAQWKVIQLLRKRKLKNFR